MLSVSLCDLHFTCSKPDAVSVRSMDKMRAMELILAAKAAKGLTFSEIAAAVDRHTVWTTSALLGQQQMSVHEADAVTGLLGLEPEVARALQGPARQGFAHGGAAPFGRW